MAADSFAIRERIEREIKNPKKWAIMRLVAQGLRNKSIAAQVGLSENVVKLYLHNIYEVCGVDDRLGLTVFLLEHGIVRVPTRMELLIEKV